MGTRRQFMKNALACSVGLGSAGSGAGPARVGSGRVSANGTLAVGLIGCRNQGWTDLSAFLKHREVVCAALCDVDEEWLFKRAADVEKLRGKKPVLFKDFRRLIERKDIDAVIVGTPDHWHCLPFVAACEAGKDVYVEKPLANSIAECNAMRNAARKYNRVVQVGQQQRSGNHWTDAIALVKAGTLGTVRMAKCWANFNYGSGQPAVPDESVPRGVDFDLWLGPAPARTFNRTRFHGSWRMFWDYGGGLQTDWGVHLIDMGLWAMAESDFPKSVTAAGGIFASRGRSVETADTQTVLYAYDGFTMVWEHHAGIQTGPYGRNYGVAFIGSNGTLVADRDNWVVFPEGPEDKPRTPAVPPQRSDHKEHERHVADFVECVKTRGKPAADIDVGWRAAVHAHFGNIAYRTGHTLAWDESGDRFAGDPEANTLVRPFYRKPWSFPEI